MRLINTKTGEPLYINSFELAKLTGLKQFQIMYKVRMGNLPEPILLIDNSHYKNHFFTCEIKDWIKIHYPDKIHELDKLLTKKQ